MMTNIQNNDNSVLNFDYMYNTYKNKIWLIICQCLVDKQSCEEVLQDVFKVFDEKIEIFDSEEGAVKWLKTVTYNKIRDYNRKTQTYIKHFEFKPNDDEVFKEYSDSPKNEPLHRIIDNENVFELLSAIHELKPIYRDVIYLVYYVEWTPKQISQKYNIPLNTVYSRIKKAKAILRNKRELDFLRGRVEYDRKG